MYVHIYICAYIYIRTYYIAGHIGTYIPICPHTHIHEMVSAHVREDKKKNRKKLKRRRNTHLGGKSVSQLLLINCLCQRGKREKKNISVNTKSVKHTYIRRKKNEKKISEKEGEKKYS